ncbi:hypothetical protein CABS01_01843 [Colletotrichum abscissum]|uniref:uncharacterized protein n=1 Tax=Colletotrichum abscissum TaxID=1671311 RepID=UPI0027D662CA|nr:uncharacterized protein CABS01_01843 [Colletotrichum abscissum]KAK1496036.1 hypothetical protein CABS01_01843 [Colletotrichum abscissum]
MVLVTVMMWLPLSTLNTQECKEGCFRAATLSDVAPPPPPGPFSKLSETGPTIRAKMTISSSQMSNITFPTANINMRSIRSFIVGL